MLQQFIAGYLNFSKKERSGIYLLLILIIFFAILPFFYPLLIKDKPVDHKQFEKEVAALKIVEEDSSAGYKQSNYTENNYRSYEEQPTRNYTPQPEGEVFRFDPNTLSAEGWKKLGVKDRTIETIQKYLSKGGKFRTPEDIGKIWGLNKQLVDRLLPYVQINEPAQQNNPTVFKQENNYTYTRPAKKEYAPIDINTADSTAFISLPGIGSRLSFRIINFRDKLGGFLSVDQLGETFGLPDSTFQLIKPRLVLNNTAIRQININTATIDQLKTHPYIRYATANAIVQYRTQHGNYTSVEDIKKIMTINAELFNKIAPYLKVN